MTKKIIRSVQEVSWHRNGLGGKGFYAILFTSDIEAISEEESKLWAFKQSEGVKNAKWLACVTDDPGECYVICLDRIPTDGVKFGSNSWRGDLFEPELRKAIAEMQSSGSVRMGPFGIPT